MKAFHDLIVCLWILALALQDLSTRKAFTQGRQCEDVLPDCAYHFNMKDCDKYSSVTRKYCLKTCSYCPTPPSTTLSPCKDILADCAVYIKSPSQCHGAQEFFTKYCPSTCGYCACDDILEDCSSYVSDPNQCQSSPFFTKYCKRTCNICETSTVSTPVTSAMIQPSPSTPTPLKHPPPSTEALSSQSSLTDSSLTKFSSTESPLTKSSSTDPSLAESSSTQESQSQMSQSTESPLSPSSPSPSLTNTPSTTETTIQPGPLGCADILPDCASMVANDKDSCKTREMEENCPKSCSLCGVDPQCEDKLPEDCASVIARDKEYCKTNPEYMKENCARTCQYCGCHDLLLLCASLVANNKDYCTTNPVFMTTNCPKSCDLCYNDGDGDVKPPATSNDCVDKRKRCQTFASIKNYCTYQSAFMRRHCPKSCQFCEKEYNFEIKTEWNGKQINHAPIKFQISAQDSRVVLISVSGPFFDDPGPPPCAVGSACDGLWDYEVAEVFFLGKKEKYLEIELSPHGQHLLLMLNGVRKPFKDKLPIEYTATIDRANGSWTGTAKIPIDYFPPGVHKINAYAIHGSGINRRYESLYPAPADAKSPDFHHLELFKPFDFEAMFTLSWSKPVSLYWKNIGRLLRARSRA
ncbi:uncharacterized protein LOC110045264 [Orbicella faveolata]|uniref:uncharacterized protein LOC110045264 n=1 Tax=Orbicella faveolata TaxID=48498 RepID=UPI0009E33FC8|nr:uncharacterized protein LOC110045264 [Orbicella faveolata]